MYQAPRMGENSLEAEGIFCQSFRGNSQVDEFNIIGDEGTDPEEPSHFEF